MAAGWTSWTVVQVAPLKRARAPCEKRVAIWGLLARRRRRGASGVPLWAAEATTDFPVPLASRWTPEGPQGVPSLDQCAKFGWGLYQATYAGANAYERLCVSCRSRV